MGKKSLLIIALICIVLSSTQLALGEEHPHLSIYYPKEALDNTAYPTYVSDIDPWINESWVYYAECTNEYTFDVGVMNKDKVEVQNIRLLIAIPSTTTSDDLAFIKVSGGVSGEVQFKLNDFGRSDPNPFTPTMSHGVYPPSGNANWTSSYIIGNLGPNEIINLTITIGLGNSPSSFKVHFDVFNDSNWHNPFSHDSTFIYTCRPPPPVPEFPTIAVPIAAILSLLFAAIHLRRTQ